MIAKQILDSERADEDWGAKLCVRRRKDLKTHRGDRLELIAKNILKREKNYALGLQLANQFMANQIREAKQTARKILKENPKKWYSESLARIIKYL